jgi:hypothetical protein
VPDLISARNFVSFLKLQGGRDPFERSGRGSAVGSSCEHIVGLSQLRFLHVKRKARTPPSFEHSRISYPCSAARTANSRYNSAMRAGPRRSTKSAENEQSNSSSPRRNIPPSEFTRLSIFSLRPLIFNTVTSHHSSLLNDTVITTKSPQQPHLRDYLTFITPWALSGVLQGN